MIKKLTHVTAKELDALLAIWLTTTIEAHSFIPETYWRENLDLVKEQLPQADVYIYSKQGEIIAFMGIVETYIAGIFVKKDYQSQGIGQLLLTQAKEAHAQLTLSVYEKNQPALDFYLKQGFKIMENQIDNTGEQEYQMSWHK